MRRWTCYALAGICALVLALAAYAILVIVAARSTTEDTVARYERSHAMPLALRELSPRQLEILLAIEDPV